MIHDTEGSRCTKCKKESSPLIFEHESFLPTLVMRIRPSPFFVGESYIGAIVDVSENNNRRMEYSIGARRTISTLSEIVP